MATIINTFLVLMVVGNIILLGSSRVFLSIRIVAIQGWLLGLMPVFSFEKGAFWRNFIVVTVSILIKGVVFPVLLGRTVRRVHVNREIEPFISFSFSMFIAVGLLLISFWINEKLGRLVIASQALLVPVALFTILVGLFDIVSRKKAISQALGYLVFENGIWLLSVGLVSETSVMLELAILLDVFVAVFVLGIAIYQINREFEHIDMDKLSTLRG